MIAGLKGFKRWIFLGAVGFLGLLAVAAFVYRVDILRTALDPKVPFQTYDPPPAPDYMSRAAWALLPADLDARPTLPADIFFIHPTTYDGGRHWNAPIDEPQANRTLTRVMLPNHAGPFVRVGRIFAPRYRQASLYTLLTLREDARDARAFAYGDVRAAFRHFVEHQSHGRPFIIVGVEQGGTLAARLLAEEVAPNPELLQRMAAAYLIETVTPRAAYPAEGPLPACQTRAQAHCVVAWASAREGDDQRARDLLQRSLVFDAAGSLEALGGRDPLCVNPLTGSLTDDKVPARAGLGAANATGLEWGARPAFLKRQAGAQCSGGVLRVGRPKSPSLKPAGSWADRLKAPSFNLFYADLEADAQARVAAYLHRPDFPKPAPPILKSIDIRPSPIRKVR